MFIAFTYKNIEKLTLWFYELSNMQNYYLITTVSDIIIKINILIFL